MTWTVSKWIWQVETPISIGMPPAGALNRCRLYVPARVLWGAITAETSRSKNTNDFPDYAKYGEDIARDLRFTYLFPSEKRGGKFYVWLPKYKMGNGLVWHCNGSELPDRDFRRKLLDSRASTAIAPESDVAIDGTLRESECINPWWQNPGNGHKLNHVLLCGYVFSKNGSLSKELAEFKTLFVGGDTRYGLGKICRVGWHEVSGDLSVFEKRAHLDGEHPEIQSDIVWGHAVEDGQPQIQGMQGVKELLDGWNQGSLWRGNLTWAPGSFLERSVAWSINKYGYWMHQGNK